MKFNDDTIEERFLNDGVYAWSSEDRIDILDIGHTEYDSPVPESALSFMAQHPDYAIARAYETYRTFLLSRAPQKFSGVILGSGFNYGSTNILKWKRSAYDSILILAQND